MCTPINPHLALIQQPLSSAAWGAYSWALKRYRYRGVGDVSADLTREPEEKPETTGE